MNPLMGLLEFGMTMRDAINLPRLVARNDVTLVEAALFDDPTLTAQLRAAGVRLSGDFGRRPLGFVQAAMVHTDGTLAGAADTARLDSASAMAF